MEVEGGVIDPTEVAGAGGLVLLGLERERVDVDALGLGDVAVVLVGLHQVEVTAGLGVEPVVSVQLQLGLHQGVDGLAVNDGRVIRRIVRGRVYVRNDHPN